MHRNSSIECRGITLKIRVSILGTVLLVRSLRSQNNNIFEKNGGFTKIVFYPTRPIRAVLEQVSPSLMSGCTIIPSKKAQHGIWLQILLPAKSEPNAKLETRTGECDCARRMPLAVSRHAAD